MQLSSKKLLLVICKILRLFSNTFTTHDKSSIVNRKYLKHRTHMQLSQKQRAFCQFFSTFLISQLNFEHIQKKGDIHS